MSATAETWTAHLLPVPADGSGSSWVYSINDVGVSVGSYSVGLNEVGLLWTDLVPTRVPPLSTYASTVVRRINNAGSVSGTLHTPLIPGVSAEAIWVRPAGSTIVRTFAPTGGTDGIDVNDMNGAGLVVGSFRTAAGVRHAYKWGTSGFVDLHPVGWTQSEALGVSDAATVSGWTSRPASGMRAAHWSLLAGFTTLAGNLAGPITSDGATIIRRSTALGSTLTLRETSGAEHYVYWPTGNTSVTGISDLRRVVGSRQSGASWRAITGDGSSFTQLPVPPGALDTWAYGVNRCGNVVGNARFVGAYRAVLWRISSCDSAVLIP